VGLEAQRHAVAQHLGADQRYIVAEFIEVESGRKVNRPELGRALATCRLYNATLVVAKLDRLARNAAFLLALRDSNVDFVCADVPEANRLTIGILAVVAEAEVDYIAARCKETYEVLRRRGASIGNAGNMTEEGRRRGQRAGNARRRLIAEQRAWDLTPIVGALRASGARTVQEIADGLNARGFRAPQGGPWNEWTTRPLLARIDGNPSLDDALALIRAELGRRGGHHDRNAQIYRDRLAGRTFASLGEEHGLPPQRISRLCQLAAHPSLADGWKPQESPRSDIDLRGYLEQLLLETREKGKRRSSRRSDLPT
jgi:DNA invertase Pin-like site-specific DNA recombinase